MYRWLPGVPALVERIVDPERFAADLADFLTALNAIDPAGGPAAGEHSFFRGGPLATSRPRYPCRDLGAAGTRRGDAGDGRVGCGAGRRLARPVRVGARRRHAVQPARRRRPARSGDRLRLAAVGDPACDLAIAWTFFRGDSRRAFRDRLAVDDAAWTRGRGWALWKALITLDAALRRDPGGGDRAGLQFGWRTGAREMIVEILAEFAAGR